MTEHEGQAVLTRKRAETIYNAWETWIGVIFYAGDNWHKYQLIRSTLTCFYSNDKEPKYVWNVRDVLISQDWLTIITDCDLEIRFRIKGESR